MVAAGELRRAAAVAVGKRPGAMTADVMQRAQGAAVAEHDHERHAGDPGQCVVTRRRHLRRVADELPASPEHGAALDGGELRLRVAGRRQRQGGGRRLRGEGGLVQGGRGAGVVVHLCSAGADAGHCRNGRRA